MLRRILPAAVLAGVAVFGFFWWLTIPVVVPANSLAAYQPDLANGLTTVNAGGYSSYQQAKLEAVRDLFVYLKTLARVPGKVRDLEVPFPFDIRRNVGVWKWLFMDGQRFVPDPARSAPWNRGAYLVNGLGHCAEC